MSKCAGQTLRGYLCVLDKHHYGPCTHPADAPSPTPRDAGATPCYCKHHATGNEDCDNCIGCEASSSAYLAGQAAQKAKDAGIVRLIFKKAGTPDAGEAVARAIEEAK